MIVRHIAKKIKKHIFSGKAIIVSGPRQVGKTTLIQEIISENKAKTLFLNGDDASVLDMLNRPNTEQIRQILGDNKIVFIDEAQRIFDIGLTSKIIVDQFKDVQLILSGSSSFDLYNKLQEPLTGRKWTYNLWPITFAEWQDHVGYVKAELDLENRLIYGLYPEVLTSQARPDLVLKELSSSYLYKDVLLYEGLKKPQAIQKLLKAIAFQIGNEVSYTELGQITGLDPKTVDAYIDILEKAFIIFRLTPFSRNLRNEIKAKNKIYFYDNGIRNIVIGQLMPLSMRQDVGQLWENFLISERVKLISQNKWTRFSYFWRTTQQQEIDYIEEVNGELFAYEIKWNENKKIKFPKTFTNNYDSQTIGITRKNFRDFIIPSF